MDLKDTDWFKIKLLTLAKALETSPMISRISSQTQMEFDVVCGAIFHTRHLPQENPMSSFQAKIQKKKYNPMHQLQQPGNKFRKRNWLLKDWKGLKLKKKGK